MKYEPLTEGHYFHIYNCGNNREDIFIEEKNYNFFLSLLKKHILPCSDILAFCLLKNHFHLLVYLKEDCVLRRLTRYFAELHHSTQVRYESSCKEYAWLYHH